MPASIDLRSLLPATQTHCFLNYGATAPLLKPSADRMQEIISRYLLPMPTQFEHFVKLLEQSRKIIADLIGASPAEIAFSSSTSMGLSLIAHAIRWRRGDRVLYPADEYPSNRFAWQNLESFGVQACALHIGPDQNILEALRQADLTNVKLFSFSAVSFISGRRQNVREICDYCHAQGILVCVDAVQAVGAIPVNVQQWDNDFLACGGQKWLLGPIGSGFFFVKGSLLDSLHVPLIGWGSVRNPADIEALRPEFIDGLRRFEPGFLDIANIVGLSESVSILSHYGFPLIFDRVSAFNQQLRHSLKSQGFGIVHDGPPDTQSGMVSVSFEDTDHLRSIFKSCLEAHIILTKRKNSLRICAHATTNDADIQKVLDVFHQQAKASVRAPLPNPSAEFPKKQPSTTKSEKPRALITGASHGLGEALAQELAKAGFDLCLLARNETKLNQLKSTLEQRYATSITIAAIDLSQQALLQEWLSQHQHDLHFDLLVNNAADARAGLFQDTSYTSLEQSFAVNFFAPYLITQKILPFMLERGQGKILNIVTTGARCALPLFSAYNAAKGALWSWSEALTLELKPKGISVTTFLPPHMETATQQQLGRVALAHYQNHTAKSNFMTTETVAALAVRAVLRSQAVVVPSQSKWQIAVNALFPEWTQQKINRLWKS